MKEVLTEDLLMKIRDLRRTLHMYPDLSGKEKKTSERIKLHLEGSDPDFLLEGLGGYGLAAVYDSNKKGPSVMFRADLDALPIHENNSFAHRSLHDGSAHACGHDGHMAVIAGFSSLLKTYRPQSGRIILLFQPEEETGQGAARVLADDAFRKILPDLVFSFHNLPGFRKNIVVLKEDSFSAASKGMIFRLKGRSSHAAQPEKGNSPVLMFTRLIDGLAALAEKKENYMDFVLLTVIHARLGEKAFGTNPGEAVVMATLRTFLDEDINILTEKAEALAVELSEKYQIEMSISFTEEFPAAVNDSSAVDIVRKAAVELGADFEFINDTFRWSEDFGHFTSRFPGALFGIGSGIDHSSLHNPDFDFPDEIIETATGIFFNIATQTVKLQNNA